MYRLKNNLMYPIAIVTNRDTHIPLEEVGSSNIWVEEVAEEEVGAQHNMQEEQPHY